MSLKLDGVRPEPIRADTRLSNLLKSDSETILRIGDYEIPLGDFKILVMYVMLNTPLTENDPRFELIRELEQLIVVENQFGRRLAGTSPLAQMLQIR
jgi:hypothetical protein